MRRDTRAAVEGLHRLKVERADAIALSQGLDRLWQERAESLRYNSVYGLAFVRHPERYSLWNNSNRKVAEWLGRLGCGIEGSALWSSWQVAEP